MGHGRPANGEWWVANGEWWCTGIEFNSLNMNISHDTISCAAYRSTGSRSSSKLLTLNIICLFAVLLRAPIHDPSATSAIVRPVWMWVHRAKTNNKPNSKRATLSLLRWLGSPMRAPFAAAAVRIVSILWPLHATTTFGALNRIACTPERETLPCRSRCVGILPLV